MIESGTVSPHGSVSVWVTVPAQLMRAGGGVGIEASTDATAAAHEPAPPVWRAWSWCLAAKWPGARMAAAEPARARRTVWESILGEDELMTCSGTVRKDGT